MAGDRKDKEKEKEGKRKDEEEVGEETFSPEDMQKLVMDFFVVQGYSEAAKVFEKETAVPLPQE